MCELLVFVKDRPASGNLSKDAAAPKCGDVIEVKPDGWPWGKCERGEIIAGNPNGNHSFFRIVKLPNVSMAAASTLMAGEHQIDPNRPSPFLQHRAKFIDIAKAHPVTMKLLIDHWNDDSRKDPHIALDYNAEQLNSIVSSRPRIPF